MPFSPNIRVTLSLLTLLSVIAAGLGTNFIGWVYTGLIVLLTVQIAFSTTSLFYQKKRTTSKTWDEINEEDDRCWNPLNIPTFMCIGTIPFLSGHTKIGGTLLGLALVSTLIEECRKRKDRDPKKDSPRTQEQENPSASKMMGLEPYQPSQSGNLRGKYNSASKEWNPNPTQRTWQLIALALVIGALIGRRKNN